MSTQVKRALERFSKSIQTNTPKIHKRLTKAGVQRDPALVLSAAKYLRALNKLAKA